MVCCDILRFLLPHLPQTIHFQIHFQIQIVKSQFPSKLSCVVTGLWGGAELANLLGKVFMNETIFTPELGTHTFTVQPHILTHINILVFLLVWKENCTTFRCVLFVYGRKPTVYMFCQPNTVANPITFLPKKYSFSSSILSQQMEYAGTF